MAELLDGSVNISKDGMPTIIFEEYWFGVTELTTNEPSLDLSLPVFKDGFATLYFEDLWGLVADDLGKETLDVTLLLEQDGYPTAELEALWEDLIT